MEDILKNLKEPINYKWKPQSQTKDKTKWQCVAYIDSRDVQEVLDKVCGANWQSKYYEVGGKLFCSIGIKIGDEWVWRSDSGFLENEYIEAGTQSKGEVSDTFKRAAVQWGIGRFLYSKKIQWITDQEFQKNKYNLTEYIEGKIGGKTQETEKRGNTKQDDLLVAIQNAESIERLMVLEPHIETTCVTEKQKSYFKIQFQERYKQLNRV